MIVFFIAPTLLAQKEDHIWISNFWSVDSCSTSPFPDICGATLVDFNELPPLVYRDLKLTLDFLECNTSICDENGELLLYCNAQSIHGDQRDWITNGRIINYGPKWEWLTWDNENGQSRPTGFRAPQSAGFIPIPNMIDAYWALYQNYENEENTPNKYNELWASYIKRNDEGNLQVINKDTVINKALGRRGNLTACKHGNGRDWWFLQFNKDTVYTYLVDPTGIHLDHLQFLPFQLRHSFGQSKFSQQGDQYALYGTIDYNQPNGADFMYAGFDRCTGDLIDPEYHQLHGNGWLNSGVEFSPDGNLLYISNLYELFQIDLENDPVFDTKILIQEQNGDTCLIGSNMQLTFSQLQVGPDNKIYLADSGQCNKMHRIEKPNERGEACEFNQGIITLDTYVSGTIPNFNTYRLGPLDGSDCDSLGINNDPVSRFWYEQDSMDHRNIQFWDVSYFRPESWAWDFGDGNGSEDRFPQHEYDSNGSYEVCLTVSNENSSNTSCQILQLGPSAIEDQSLNYNITLFPNPVEENARLLIHDYLPEDGIIKIYNLSGIMVHEQRVTHGENNLFLPLLDSGAYVYELLDGGKLFGNGKFVKF